MKLSKKDIGTLQYAVDLCRRFDAGIRFAHFHRLEKLGMLRFVGLGSDIDEEAAGAPGANQLAVLLFGETSLE